MRNHTTASFIRVVDSGFVRFTTGADQNLTEVEMDGLDVSVNVNVGFASNRNDTFDIELLRPEE